MAIDIRLPAIYTGYIIARVPLGIYGKAVALKSLIQDFTEFGDYHLRGQLRQDVLWLAQIATLMPSPTGLQWVADQMVAILDIAAPTGTRIAPDQAGYLRYLPQ